MLGHGSIVAFDDRTDMRALARHLLRFGARESCGKCFPCRSGCNAASSRSRPTGRSTATGSRSCSRRSRSRASARTASGMPAPIRSLLAHFPEELEVT